MKNKTKYRIGKASRLKNKKTKYQRDWRRRRYRSGRRFYNRSNLLRSSTTPRPRNCLVELAPLPSIDTEWPIGRIDILNQEHPHSTQEEDSKPKREAQNPSFFTRYTFLSYISSDVRSPCDYKEGVKGNDECPPCRRNISQGKKQPLCIASVAWNSWVVRDLIKIENDSDALKEVYDQKGKSSEPTCNKKIYKPEEPLSPCLVSVVSPWGSTRFHGSED